MRILQVTPYFEDAWAYGGVPRAVTATANALARRGHSVTVCTTDAYTADARLPSRQGCRDSESTVDVHLFPNLSNAAAYHLQFFLPLGLGQYLRAHARDFDVAHIHACHNVPGAVAARHLNRAGVPYILTPHGTGPYRERRRAAKRLFDRTIGRGVLEGARRIIAVSDAERTELVAFGAPEAAIQVIPNPIDTAACTPGPRGAFRKRFGVDESAHLVLFLGKLTAQKRLDTLVQAFASLDRRNLRLAIAGNDMGYGRTLNRLIDRLRIHDRVHIPGLLRGAERFSALADADLVVYPSEGEVFGLVPVEALLCGTPVVVGNDSGCGEIVQRAGGGILVEPGNVTALRDAIADVLDRRAVWRDRAALARAHLAQYDSDRVSEAIEDVYRDVAGHLATDRELPVRTTPQEGVTFLVPVLNGGRWLDDVLASIQSQADGRPFEILAVEDGSTDDSPAILARHAAASNAIRIVQGPRRGATAALNEGLRRAAHPIICQVDQDVILQPGWLPRLVRALEDPRVGAAQGYYVTPRDGTIWARVMGLDLERRYRRLQAADTDHVCTGNTAYRTAALRAVGGFDETLGYGYDNDMSYRLIAAGHRLVICPEARSVHKWRDDCWGYLMQQYGFGYGRLDLVAKHRHRFGGDEVSPFSMMLHAPLALAAGLSGLLAIALGMSGRSFWPAATIAIALLSLLTVERFIAGLQASLAFRTSAGLWFAPVHVLRDLAWAAAMLMWGLRRLSGRVADPSASMLPRSAHAPPAKGGMRSRIIES